MIRHHSYLLAPTQPTPDTEWAVEIDYHSFRPFWAPLNVTLTSGADVIEPQRRSLEYLRDLPDEASLQPGSSNTFP